jgi:hypothetical protein
VGLFGQSSGVECTLTNQHPINDRAQRIHHLTFGIIGILSHL